jgi:hypothetical protein
VAGGASGRNNASGQVLAFSGFIAPDFPPPLAFIPSLAGGACPFYLPAPPSLIDRRRVGLSSEKTRGPRWIRHISSACGDGARVFSSFGRQWVNLWIRWHVGTRRRHADGRWMGGSGRWPWLWLAGGARPHAMRPAGVSLTRRRGAWLRPVGGAEPQRCLWPSAHGASRGFGVRFPASPSRFVTGMGFRLHMPLRGSQIGVTGHQFGQVVDPPTDLKEEVWRAHGSGRHRWICAAVGAMAG